MNVADFFCGCGGFGKGFHNSGFKVKIATDIWSDALQSHELNFPGTEHILGDISNENCKQQIQKICSEEEIDVFIGGPPCQSFSSAGKRDENDPRGQLFFDYIELVDRIKPKIVVAENVKGILTMKFGDVFVTKKITDSFSKIGYNCEFRLLNAADYGVPQTRQRVIFIATRLDIDILPVDCFPKQTHKSANYKTVRQSIDDLADLEDDESFNHVRTKHSDSFKKRLLDTKFGESATPKYKEAFFKLWPDKPALTVKGNNGGVFLHYRDPRVMTARELARLQSFPDSYRFFGRKGSVYKQLGNAVPVGLSSAIADQIKNILLSKKRKRTI
tara:strand:- start:1000 stop:1989 length:990 start_codon:yes stop_codon:yes gene_type:complete